ncbi:MAG: hypothetical protein KJO65_08285 [Gemmatimonadetes bacterium]|nr:hypothetical protein [Gemmatimonadota bacterium]
MSHADPWDEVQRLEQLLDADLRAELQKSKLRAAAESYCVDKCRVDGSCPIERALPVKADCPLFKYTRAVTDAIVPDRLS